MRAGPKAAVAAPASPPMSPHPAYIQCVPVTGMFGRFTLRAQQVVSLAQRAARDAMHNYVGTEHVLIGILDEGTSVAVKVLARLDIDTEHLRAELRASMGLLGLLATDEGLASKVLRRMGVELRTTRQAVVAVLSSYAAQPTQRAAAATPSQATLTKILERLDAIERRLPS